MIEEVQQTVASALGGETVTTTVEGRERYSVNVRYPRDLRSDPQAIASEVLVPTVRGGMVPLGQVADVQANPGADHHPHRERPARGLYLRRFPRPRSRRLRRRCPARPCGKRSSSRPATYAVWSGQFEYLRAGRGAVEDRRAGNAAADLRAALSQLPAASPRR